MILWTPGLVEERLRQALITLRRMPGRHVWPAGMKTNWPDFVRSYAEAYGYSSAGNPRVMATAREIEEMDEALGWLSAALNARAAVDRGLPRDVAQIVWMRAGGVPWTRIMQHRIEWWGIKSTSRGGRSVIDGGNSYPSLRRIYADALALLARRLNGGRDHAAPPQLRQDEGPRYEEVVEVTFPVGEEGSYGPVHARARWVFRRSRKRGV